MVPEHLESTPNTLPMPGTSPNVEKPGSSLKPTELIKLSESKLLYIHQMCLSVDLIQNLGVVVGGELVAILAMEHCQRD